MMRTVAIADPNGLADGTAYSNDVIDQLAGIGKLRRVRGGGFQPPYFSAEGSRRYGEESYGDT
jgi:hypothetical protein